MKVLVVDSTTESQALVAAKIQEFSPADIEVLDLRLKLANPQDYQERILGADVLFLGPGVEEYASTISRAARATNPSVHIIMIVSDQSYSAGIFRSAHLIGVQKIFPLSVKSLDILQELIGVHTLFRRAGRATEGKIIAVTHIKGGVGATSITAGLGEVCANYGKKTLLWDMDIESRDLSRGLMVSGYQSSVVSSWVNGSAEITRQTFKDALFPVSAEANVLMPPDKFREGLDLACHCDGAMIAQRILDLSRVTHDVVLIDTAARLGPSIGAILRIADYVLVVIDDSTLGLTAVDFYMTALKEILGNLDRVTFISSGNQVSLKQIQTELTVAHKLTPAAWRLPAIPYDAKAGTWPGLGKTLFSLGQSATQLALTEIAQTLGLIEPNTVENLAASQGKQAVPAKQIVPRAADSKGVFGKVYQRIFEQ